MIKVTTKLLALTAAAIDTAAPTGFGGLAYIPGVGSFSAIGATP